MIADFLQSRAKLTPQAIAFIEYDTKIARDFATLNQRSNALAGYLSQKSVKAGDRIGVLCRNRIAFFELLFACAKIGAILVPFNWRAPPEENVPLFEQIEPKIMFYGNEDAQNSMAIAINCPQINFDEDYESVLDFEYEFKPRDFWPDDDAWYLIFTSGTTGRPKAVMQTYRMAMANAFNLGQAIDICADDKFLNFLPLFHTAGINLHTLPALIQGCTSHIIPGFDAGKVLNLIQNGEISCFFGVPQVYLLLSQHAEFSKTDIAKLRHWGCGGAPMPDYLIETFANRGALVCNGMGMTETGPTVFMMDKANVKSKIGSVGKAQILTIARVVDAEFNDCPKNVAGDLVFAGPNITTGYWQNQAATIDAFHIDEFGQKWLKSGDVAVIDDDGYYYIVGRSKEMFISGGENVYPAEVENVILGHKAVLEVAIIGIDDAKWGEVGMAFIHSKNPPSIEELIDFCKKRLAPYKIPKKFKFVDDFPRTAAGKIQKHILKKEYENAN